MIPDSLRSRPTWVLRDGEKGPCDPSGARVDATNPINWQPYEYAAQAASHEPAVSGLGFVFTSDGPLVGVDLDNCRHPGTGSVSDWAKAIVDELDSYTTISTSGTGLHVYLKAPGGVPDGGNRNNDVEIYDGNRFFVFTGEHYEPSPTSVNERESELEAIHGSYILENDEPEQQATVDVSRSATAAADHVDTEILEKARTAATGDKFTRLFDRGDTSGYGSHSEADLALMNMLAFWTDKHKHRMIRLFRQSTLGDRDKADRDDYVERTADKAIRDTDNTYDPTYYDADTASALSTPGGSVAVAADD